MGFHIHLRTVRGSCTLLQFCESSPLGTVGQVRRRPAGVGEGNSGGEKGGGKVQGVSVLGGGGSEWQSLSACEGPTS